MHITIYNDSPEFLYPFTYFRPSWDVPVGGRTLRQLLVTNFPASDLEFISQPLPSSPNHSIGITLSARTLPTNDLINQLLKSEIFNLKSVLLSAPWDLIHYHEQLLHEEIQARIASKNYFETRPGVFVKNDQKQLPHTCITHTGAGPIVLGDNITIEEFTVLRGPLLIEDNCVIKDFATIADSYLGPRVRVGGEIKFVNFFGFANKQHHGFLGHSVIGEWVNLGAGTTTSNLKNTYGTIRKALPWKKGEDEYSPKMETNLQFLGSLIGDHTKCAINTTLMTGTILGASVHAYDLIYGNIPSFTQIFHGQRAELPLKVAITIAERVMARRNIIMSEEQKKTFEKVFTETAPDRAAFNVQPDTKLSFM